MYLNSFFNFFSNNNTYKFKMSKIIDILINDKLITDISLLEKARSILANMSYENLIELVKYKERITSGINKSYYEEIDKIMESDLNDSFKEKKINDIVLEYFVKRKELEYRFVSQLE